MMGARFIVVAAAFLMLAACSSTPEPGGPGGPSGPGGISSSRFGPGSQQDLAATAGDRVFFAYDSAEIPSEGQQILQRQAEWLRRYPNVAVTIEGHCDERGTREYNLALGERRAQAVQLVLFGQSLLPRACFGVALGLAVAASSAPAQSQDRLTFERLDRIERDLNMLQRQVYRGAPAPMMSGDPGSAASGEVRMDRIEQQ